MIRDDDEWPRIADAFQSAALDGTSWYAALEALAAATGSQTGELIGVGSKATVPFNIMTNMDPAFQKNFVAAGGGDPTVNPRVGAGIKSQLHLEEWDELSPGGRLHHSRKSVSDDHRCKWAVPGVLLRADAPARRLIPTLPSTHTFSRFWALPVPKPPPCMIMAGGLSDCYEIPAAPP